MSFIRWLGGGMLGWVVRLAAMASSWTNMPKLFKMLPINTKRQEIVEYVTAHPVTFI